MTCWCCIILEELSWEEGRPKRSEKIYRMALLVNYKGRRGRESGLEPSKE